MSQRTTDTSPNTTMLLRPPIPPLPPPRWAVSRWSPGPQGRGAVVDLSKHYDALAAAEKGVAASLVRRDSLLLSRNRMRRDRESGGASSAPLELWTVERLRPYLPQPKVGRGFLRPPLPSAALRCPALPRAPVRTFSVTFCPAAAARDQPASTAHSAAAAPPASNGVLGAPCPLRAGKLPMGPFGSLWVPLGGPQPLSAKSAEARDALVAKRGGVALPPNPLALRLPPVAGTSEPPYWGSFDAEVRRGIGPLIMARSGQVLSTPMLSADPRGRVGCHPGSGGVARCGRACAGDAPTPKPSLLLTRAPCLVWGTSLSGSAAVLQPAQAPGNAPRLRRAASRMAPPRRALGSRDGRPHLVPRHG